jgi:acetyltransferase-like isoleucine patch superfamily enzyme
MRNIWLIIAVILPLPLKLMIYRNLMGWTIGKNVKIGFSYLEGDTIILDDNAIIGHFNLIRCFRHFQVGKHTRIANFSEFFGRRDHPRWPGSLIIGDRVQFMSHHFVDACGTVTIGDRTTVGGRGTHFWSHSLLYEKDGPVLSPLEIHIGEQVYVGAGTILVGCKIPDQAVIGAGSVVTKTFAPEAGRILIAGNPAVIKKRYYTTTSSPSQEMSATNGTTTNGADQDQQ